MKKHLLCTSAIALGVAAAPAAAQDWNLDWGGFYNTHIAYADQGGLLNVGLDADGLEVVGNAEIIFTPSITLDNGMTFGINVQLEAQNQGAVVAGVNQTYIDESYVFISSDTLGRLEMGGENSAGYKLMVGAPSVGSFAISSASVSLVSNITHAFRQANGSVFTEVAGNNDVQRISYFTPDFNGFTAGISYAPGIIGNASNSGGIVNRQAIISDVFDIGVNYAGSFGAVNVNFGARWGTADQTLAGKLAGLSDPETWGVGFQVGFSGFTFGMAYAENDNGGLLGIGDRKGMTAGISYDIAGPWTIGLEGFQGEFDNGPFVVDTEYNAYKLAASRQIGPGVSMDIYAITAENKNVGGVAIAKRDVSVLGTSLNLSF